MNFFREIFGFSEKFWKLRISFPFSAAEATVNVFDLVQKRLI
jgi:hypothetical protein